MAFAKIKPYFDYAEYLPIAVLGILFAVEMEHTKFQIKKSCFNAVILIVVMLILYALLSIKGVDKVLAVIIATILFFTLIYVKRQFHKKPEA